MSTAGSLTTAKLDSYDVVIVGGAVIGSSVAWWLSDNPDFDGSVLVIDRDMSYQTASTSHTNSCMRQQFSNPLNIELSQFAADFVRNFQQYMHNDPEVPPLAVDHYGYMYLASDQTFADTLRTNQQIQADNGAGTVIMSPEEIKAAYPFYNVDDLICGSHNLIDEGYFDGGTMFSTWRKAARSNDVEFVEAEVVDITVVGERATRVLLSSGQTIACGTIVNAAGPRGSHVAALAGLELAIEPRKRFTFVFDCAEPLGSQVPLTIDPSGVHVRSEGDAYMAGCSPDTQADVAVAFDDFAMDPDIWEDKVWPTLAHRIPAFERIKITNRWAGHYSHHEFDHNVIVGPHPQLSNFIFVNGFSGHGLQQAPALGRGVSELISYGEYRTINLSPLGYERILLNEPFIETAII